MDEGIIPSRIEGETAKAYRAFVDYCEMGAGRTIRGLHQLCIEDASRRHRLRTLLGWSSQWHWQDRVAEYERRAAEQREQERQRQRIEWEARTVQDAERIVNWFDERWKQFEQSPKGVTPYQAREMGKLRREADDLGRRSLHLPNSVTESTVKGAGEGGEHIIRVVWGNGESDGTDAETA